MSTAEPAGRWRCASGARRCATALAVLLVAGCSSDQPAAPPPPGEPTSLHVTLSISAHKLVPGESTTITSSAKVDAGTIKVHGLEFGGLIDTTLRFPIEPGTSQTMGVTLTIPNAPIAGTITIAAFAGAGTLVDTTRGSVTIADDGPPRASLVADSAGVPGDTLPMIFEVSDAAGITAVTFTVSGAVQFTFRQAYNYAPSVTQAVRVPIPDSAAMGDSAEVMLVAIDGFKNVTTVLREVHVADFIPPGVTGVLTPKAYDYWDPFQPAEPTLFAGDSAQVVIRATDNHRLGWIGYRLEGTGDSIAVSTSSDSATFRFPVPAGIDRTSVLDLFARDSSGTQNYVEQYVDVVGAVRRPFTRLAPFPEADGVWAGRFVYDARRDLLFVANGARVTVVQLNPLARIASIALPAEGIFADLTPGGDSLVVLFGAGPQDLAVVDLTQPSWAARALGLSLNGPYAYGMRVTAADRALLTLANTWSELASQVAEVDLRTGAVRLRSVPGWPLVLDRSADHSLIVALGSSGAATYDATTDSFSPVTAIPGQNTGNVLIANFPGIDSTGQHLLFASRLYDRSLQTSRQLLLSCSPADPGLSADARWAYVGNGCSVGARYEKIDAATGAVAETVYVPFAPMRLLPLPDGQRLVVVAGNWLGVVDLR